MRYNVLVVIDNIVQYNRIKNLINSKKSKYKFVFKHSPIKSPIWSHPDFEGNQDSIIDVNENVDYIIQSFELVISVHCFQFFKKNLIDGVRCINIHPGYNPINRGWYPQVFAIINDLPIGATIHEMDSKLDNGPIIARDFVIKNIWDTSLSIYERILEKEIELFDKFFYQILDGNYVKIKPESIGNIFMKKDFNNLLELNLDEKDTFKVFYDRLRALSHGEYKNIYFHDPITEKKIYLKLEISHE